MCLLDLAMLPGMAIPAFPHVLLADCREAGFPESAV